MVATKSIKVTCSSSALKKALSFVGGAVPDNAIIPILENVLLTIEESQMIVKGSDLSITQTTVVPVESSESVNICVPHKLLTSLLSAIPEQPITLHVQPDNWTVKLATDSGEYLIPGENPIDFPKPAIKGEHETRRYLLSGIERHNFFCRLGNTLFAMCHPSKGMPALEAVCWKGNELVSSNSSALARMKGVVGAEGESYLIPARVATLLAKLGETAVDDAEIEVSADRIRCQIGARSLESPLKDERFPDFEFAFPEHSPIVWEINRLDLIGALRRVLVMGNRTTQKVVLSGISSGIEIVAEDMDYGNQGREKLRATINGKLQIGVNGKLLIDSLDQLLGETATISLSAPNRPLILTGESPEEVVLLMPIMLNPIA